MEADKTLELLNDTDVAFTDNPSLLSKNQEAALHQETFFVCICV